jgi:hypothetical protein
VGEGHGFAGLFADLETRMGMRDCGVFIVGEN